jgi:hypothetical protein
MAVLLRLVGVPSRVVNGFQRGEWNEFGGYYTVRQEDAHAWVEAYIAGRGWMSFDPSPRVDLGAERPGRLALWARYLDALRMRWNRYVIGYSLGDQIVMALALKRGSRAMQDEMERGFSRLTQRFAALGATLASRNVLLALAPGIVLSLALLVRWRHRPPSAAQARGPRIGFYEQALKLLAKRGFSMGPHVTPREFARAIRTQERSLGQVEELFELYYRIRFGGPPLSSCEEAHIKRILAHLAQHTPHDSHSSV